MEEFTLAEFAKNSENKEGTDFTPSVQENGIEQGTLIVSKLYNTMLGKITKYLRSINAELISILEEADMTPSELSEEQLLTAVMKLINQSSGHLIGEIVQSSIPLTYAGVHLLDGSLIDGNGVYKNFVDHMATLYTEEPTLFITESAYQQAITDYGVCSKFVYDATNRTIRLPKLYSATRYLIKSYNSGGFWYRIYSDGWCEQGGIAVNNTGNVVDLTINLLQEFNDNNYILLGTQQRNINSIDSYPRILEKTTTTAKFRADTNSEINWEAKGYTSITDYKVAPFYMYITLTTAAKTNIEVDIDNIITDLNDKVDKSDLAEVQCVVQTYRNGTEWYRIYSDGWCEQGGIAVNATNNIVDLTINLLIDFNDTNYILLGTQERSSVSADSYPRILEKTTATVKFRADTQSKINWEAKGYIS